MSSEIMLLVGGSADGRRVQIDGRPRVYFVPRINRLDLSIRRPEHPIGAEHLSMISEEYVRSERNVYVHSDLCGRFDVIDLLVKGYRNEIGQ